MLPAYVPETSRAVYERLVARLANVRSVRFEMMGEETVAAWNIRLDRPHRRRSGMVVRGFDEAPLGWEAFSGGCLNVVPRGMARWFAPWVEIGVDVRGQTMFLRLDPRTGLPAEVLNPSEPNTYVYRNVRLVQFPPSARRRG